MWNRTSLGLMAGSALAGFSFWIDFLAILTLAAYEYRATAVEMAGISALLLVPGMLIGPLVGRGVDRARPAPILLVTLVLRASATVLLLAGMPLPWFCALLVLRSFVAVPVEPASNVLVSRTIDQADVQRYFGTLGVLRNASKIAAPVLGSAIASLLGERASVALSVLLTSLALCCLVVALRQPGRWLGEPCVADTSKGRQAAEAATTVAPKKRALLRQLLWTVTTYAFMVFLINNQLPVLLHGAGFDKALLGVLVSSSGAGGILAASILSRRRQPEADPMRATVVSVVAVAVCFCLLGIAFLLPTGSAEVAAAALFFLTGLFSSVEAVRANVVIVQQFPDAVGAVSGKVSALQSVAMLAAPWVAALLLPFVSMSALFAIDGGMALLVLGVIHAVAWRGRGAAPPHAGPADPAMAAPAESGTAATQADRTARRHGTAGA
ncbi:MFS transporter [Ideonella sp. BN130291]|uniref:MFS transporter n=1 Tax=Ideonella sp. BN130291 TaxID=3112940 RepID=UPI002E2751E0|nr:MFS transporter [Ideonella sp. BN130291]